MLHKAVRIALMANFACFAIMTLVLGGDAISGRRAAGHYFVASHGHYTEVSHATYVYSYVHTALTFSAMFAYVGVSVLRRRLR